jgi:hypothetical protein
VTKRDPRDWRGHRMVLSIMGPEGHGKSNLYTTALQPLLVLSVDPNAEHVVCKAFDVKEADELDPEVCRFVHIPFPAVGFDEEADVEAEAKESWARLIDEVSDVRRGRCKVDPATVCLDTGSELHTLAQLAEFGRTDKISPEMRRRRMGTVNNDFKGLFRALEMAGTHVCVTHRVKDKWEKVQDRNGEEKDERVPGVYERIGFREIGNICNAEVLARFDPARSDRVSRRFGIQVLRSMARPAIVGEAFWGYEEVEGERVHTASIPFLGTLMYPKTTLDDWR